MSNVSRRRFDDGELTTAQRELLGTYIALHPRPVAAPQLGIILAKSHSAGPFRGAINALRDKGYIEPADGGDVAVGKALEMTPLEVPSAAAVQQRWRDRLKGSQALILDHVINAYPETITPEEVGQAIGKNHNAGPIRGIFNKLAALQLLTYDPQEGLRASDYLFNPTGAR
jgi:hypothetical protein